MYLSLGLDSVLYRIGLEPLTSKSLDRWSGLQGSPADSIEPNIHVHELWAMQEGVPDRQAKRDIHMHKPVYELVELSSSCNCCISPFVWDAQQSLRERLGGCGEALGRHTQPTPRRGWEVAEREGRV